MHMEDAEGNTMVFSVLRSFNNFLSQSVEEMSALTTTQVTQGSLQMQNEYAVQMMKQKDQAGQICSGLQLLQVEREKIQESQKGLKFSLKRRLMQI